MIHKFIVNKLRFVVIIVSALTLSAGIFLNSMASATVPGTNTLVDLSDSGVQGNSSNRINQQSETNEISGDGQYVVFDSTSTNLVSGITDGSVQDYVRDTVNDTTTLVSVSSSGAEADPQGGDAAISYDGQYVAFDSPATNLVSGVTDGVWNVYLHNMQTGATTLVSSNASGTEGNQDSTMQAVSADGRYVLFYSNATNLVSNVTSDSYEELYLKDTQTGAIQLVSQNSSNEPANSSSLEGVMSCDGNVIAFMSGATNLVSNDSGNGDVYVYQPSWSGNSLTDITSTGNNYSSRPSVSCNGNDVAYETFATNLIPDTTTTYESIVKYDRLNGTNTLVSQSTGGSQANGVSSAASISDDGRFVAFTSGATNLDSKSVPEGPNVFIRDTKENTTQLVSISTSDEGAGYCSYSTISADGSYIAFQSTAPNLVSNDTNDNYDVFLAPTGF